MLAGVHECVNMSKFHSFLEKLEKTNHKDNESAVGGNNHSHGIQKSTFCFDKQGYSGNKWIGIGSINFAPAIAPRDMKAPMQVH